MPYFRLDLKELLLYSTVSSSVVWAPLAWSGGFGGHGIHCQLQVDMISPNFYSCFQWRGDMRLCPTINEVKQGGAVLVLGWVTVWGKHGSWCGCLRFKLSTRTHPRPLGQIGVQHQGCTVPSSVTTKHWGIENHFTWAEDWESKL